MNMDIEDFKRIIDDIKSEIETICIEEVSEDSVWVSGLLYSRKIIDKHTKELFFERNK